MEENNLKTDILIGDGLILLDKPREMSSFLAVKIVGRTLKAKKAGHMGTLDPLASGLLVIGINKGTKLFDKFLKGEKEYLATYEFGYETDTLDTEGQVVNKNDVVVTEQEFKNTLKDFVGKQMQVPPNYSAKKINGKKAYDLARQGKEFTLPAKEVEVFDLTFLKQVAVNKFTVKIHCSSGFYVRCLGRDIAKRNGTYCTTICIRRTMCCGYDLKNAQTLEEIKEGKCQLVPLEFALEKLDLEIGKNE